MNHRNYNFVVNPYFSEALSGHLDVYGPNLPKSLGSMAYTAYNLDKQVSAKGFYFAPRAKLTAREYTPHGEGAKVTAVTSSFGEGDRLRIVRIDNIEGGFVEVADRSVGWHNDLAVKTPSGVAEVTDISENMEEAQLLITESARQFILSTPPTLL